MYGFLEVFSIGFDWYIHYISIRGGVNLICRNLQAFVGSAYWIGVFFFISEVIMFDEPLG